MGCRSRETTVEGKPHILVVEDEEPIRRLIRAALDPNAYSVSETAKGEEALQLLAEEPFDLLILDLRLDGISGWDVLDAMRTRRLRGKLRIIILTAQSSERDILRGWREGVDQYCMKPFEPAQFVRVVEAVLASTHEELARYRESELEKTQLLNLVDNAFDGQ
jgi:DNA-binding response OmpR family regulator